jgi:multidrug efflux system outer membrane protein
LISSNTLGETKAQRAVDVADYEQTKQSAFKEVADALAERATLGERLSAANALVDANAERYEL